MKKTKHLGNNFLNFHVSNPISIWKRQENEERFQRHYLFISSFPKLSLIIPQLTHVWLLAYLMLVLTGHVQSKLWYYLKLFCVCGDEANMIPLNNRWAYIYCFFIERIFVIFLPGNILKHSWISQSFLAE